MTASRAYQILEKERDIHVRHPWLEMSDITNDEIVEALTMGMKAIAAAQNGAFPPAIRRKARQQNEHTD